MIVSVRVVIVGFVFALVATFAAAQDIRVCKDVDDDAVECKTLVGGVETLVQPTVTRLVEGIVHAPGSEAAWVIVANWDAIPTTVTLRFLLQNPASGVPTLVTRTFDIPARTRGSYAVHDDPAFAGFHAFSARVFAPGDLDVTLVMRPTGPDQFRDVVLPPPIVTRPQ